ERVLCAYPGGALPLSRLLWCPLSERSRADGPLARMADAVADPLRTAHCASLLRQRTDVCAAGTSAAQRASSSQPAGEHRLGRAAPRPSAAESEPPAHHTVRPA